MHGASKSIVENRGPKVSKGQPRSLSLGSKDAHQCYSRVGKIINIGIIFFIHEEMRRGTRPKVKLGYPQ